MASLVDGADGENGIAMEHFSFASSIELEIPVSIRINNLEGYQNPIPLSVLLKRPDLRHVGSNLSPFSDLCVSVQVWADSKPLTVSVQTPYKSFKNKRDWNDWLTLPVNYASIPASAQVAITIWDLSPTEECGGASHVIPFGGTTIPLFDNDNILQKGRQRCFVHRGRTADGLSATSTPSELPSKSNSKSEDLDLSEDAKEVAELDRLSTLLKKHEMDEIHEDRWLDPMVFQYITRLEQTVSKRTTDPPLRSLPLDAKYTGDRQSFSDQGSFFLFIDFPRFDHPIVFTDSEYPEQSVSALPSQPASAPWKPPPEVLLGPGINETELEAGTLISIYDPETGIRDNLVENKHRRLVRNQRTGVFDRDLKPNSKDRNELANIISYGQGTRLKPEEKDLVWKYRHHLTRNKRALTKFVQSVAWHEPSEASQAIQILPKWTEIDVDDAIELLGPNPVNSAVRAYAVNRLRKADDDDLEVYLLQLVQALKFETLDSEDAEHTAQDSSLAKFLILRATANPRLGNFLHWFLMVECDDHSPGQSSEYRKLFAKVEYDFMVALAKDIDGTERRKTLLRQGELIIVLSKISKEIRFSKEDRIRKIERLKKLIADPENNLMSFNPPLPLPLDPNVSIVSCYPEDSSVFKSSLFPLLVYFKCATGEKYPIIFKTGDDMRQDQLVIQVIMLMDRLLRKENLDLKLSPYRILATSTMAGAVQYVPSMALAAIVTKYKGSILAYLRSNNPDESEPLGVRKEAMDTYVKSCAGYCVITYLLGVGDRHLDNLLLAPTGHFFHADFGYILGRDPKPFAPLMKLSKEMIEGMGGAQSAHYQAFKQHCFTAYTTLRKSSNLILNLFSLMVDANIPDIRMEPDKAVEKVKERFHLELKTEEEVIRMFESLIEDSVSAMFPAIIDWTHGIVQRFRA